MAEDTETVAVRAAVEAHVTDKMAVAKNVATNGRLFCVMVAACLIAGGNPRIALLMALPVGASVIIDQMPESFERAVVSVASYSFAAVVAIASFFMW